jgi:hypothetical protein
MAFRGLAGAVFKAAGIEVYPNSFIKAIIVI